MKIKEKIEEFVKTITYTIEEVPEVGTVIYTDYYNDKNKVIDSILRTEEGFDIDVPSIMEVVQDFVDQNNA